MKTCFSGIDSWMISYFKKTLQNIEVVSGIPSNLYSDDSGPINLVLAFDSIENFSILGNIFDRIVLLLETKKLSRITVFSSYSVYESDNNKETCKENFPLKPLNFNGARSLAVEGFLSYVSFRYNLPTTSLRVFNIYGPFQEPPHLIPSLLLPMIRGRSVNIGDSDKIRDFLYIDDFMRIFPLLFEKEQVNSYEVFNVGSGQGTRIGELFEKMKNITGTSPKVLFDATRLREEYDPDSAVADIGKIEKLLGWKPKICLNEGLTLTYQWLLGRSGR